LHSLAWAVFLAALAGLMVLWKISPVLRMRHIILAACLSLFVAPHLHSHDLGFLLIPLFGLIIIGGNRGETNGKTVFPFAMTRPGTNIQIKPIYGGVFLLANFPAHGFC